MSVRVRVFDYSSVQLKANAGSIFSFNVFGMLSVVVAKVLMRYFVCK